MLTITSNWVDSLNQAGTASKDIDDIEYERRIDSKDVRALCRYIESTYEEEGDFFSEGTVYLIQGLDERCLNLIEILSKNSDFFIREAVALLILNKPCVQYQQVAQELSSDDYEQVSRPARAALEKINCKI